MLVTDLCDQGTLVLSVLRTSFCAYVLHGSWYERLLNKAADALAANASAAIVGMCLHCLAVNLF